MLTRLRVKGFKNLVDTHVRFGPLTCIAGLNGVGKSNLFDAIRFLSALADKPFVEAAAETRGGSDIEHLFTAGLNGVMEFDADILIAPSGQDDFNQPAEASSTFLNYRLKLRLARDGTHGLPRVVLDSESLSYIPRDQAMERLAFAPSKAWINSVFVTSTRRADFIATVESPDDRRRIRLRSDRMRDDAKSNRGGGKPADFPAAVLPRTVLSSAQNADEARTAVLVRAEMRRWRVLQLEPTALRKPDEFQSPTAIDASGAHLPAALYRLAGSAEPERTYAHVANRLFGLVDDVRSVRVDRDDERRVLRFMVTDRTGTEFPASSLSDGTMRFVALAVIESDPQATGVLCLEEPENGIHPERIEAMVDLLEDMAVDVRERVGPENPLRQVIVSTHSPVVAGMMSPDDLVFAERRILARGAAGEPLHGVSLRAVKASWRALAASDDSSSVADEIALGRLLAYLNPSTRNAVARIPGENLRRRDDRPASVKEWAEVQMSLLADER